jgi:F-type H+-transporting ATPase subunit b
MKRTRFYVIWAVAGFLLLMPAMSFAAEAEEAPPTLVKSFAESGITAITTLIVFVALLIVLTKYAWGPIATGLKAREDKIRKDIADAEATRARAEATLKEYDAKLASAEDQVRALLAKATADAQKVADAIRTRAEQEGQERKERAEQEIKQATTAAVSQIYEQAADLVTSIAERVVPHALTGDDRQNLVNRSLDELRAVGGRN